MNPLYSVIIPLFNSCNFIGNAIESVLHQKCSDWELLVIDDGSIDEGQLIARDYSAKDRRISVYNHPDNRNKGVSASRNLGIKYASGEWIAFLDADDLWLPEKLSESAKIIMQIPDIVFIYSQAELIDVEGKPIAIQPDKLNYSHVKYKYGSGIPGKILTPFREYLTGNFDPPTSSVMIRKDILQKTNGFDESMTYAEDTLLWYQTLIHGCSYFLDKPLIYYRVHDNQWNTGKSTDLKIGRRFLVYKKLLSIVPEEFQKSVSYALIFTGLKNILRLKLVYPENNFSLIYEHYKEVFFMKGLKLWYKILSLFLLFREILLIPAKFIYFRFPK